MEPKYDIVFDQGENVGLRCPDCGQARWNAKFNPKDWSKNKDCPNCKLILDTGKVIEENKLHVLREKKKAEEKVEKEKGKKKKEAQERLAFINRKSSDAEERFQKELTNG